MQYMHDVKPENVKTAFTAWSVMATFDLNQGSAVMGRARDTKIARGVALRTYESGLQVIRITFQYKGLGCRETLNVKPNKTGEKFAINLEAEIENQIERDTFNCLKYFPDSPRASILGLSTSQRTVEEELDIWLNDIKHAHRNSTYKTYKRAVRQLKPFVGKYKLRLLICI